jgi:hypothetical protein
MTLRPIPLCVAIVLSGMLFAPSAVHAFTLEGGKGGTGGANMAATPQFDIEEQAKQFRKGQFDTSTSSTPGSTREIQTPFGKGTLQFGVTAGPTFGSPLGFNAGRAAADRRYLDRMVAPPGLQHRYDD